MSLLQNLINKFQQLFSGAAAPAPDSARAIQAKQQLFVAILEACDDGVITTDEMSDIRALQSKLGISDTELNGIKIQVLQNLIDRVMEDNIVTEEEMDFIEQIEIDLQLGVADSLKIKTDIEKVRRMYKRSKSTGVEYDDDDDFFEDEYDDDYDDTEYDDDDDLGVEEAVAMGVAGAVLADELMENEEANEEIDVEEEEELSDES